MKNVDINKIVVSKNVSFGKSIVYSDSYVNIYSLVLNVFFNIVFLKIIFFSISYSLLHHLYLPFDLFLKESIFFTTKNFLLLDLINTLTISL